MLICAPPTCCDTADEDIRVRFAFFFGPDEAICSAEKHETVFKQIAFKFAERFLSTIIYAIRHSTSELVVGDEHGSLTRDESLMRVIQTGLDINLSLFSTFRSRFDAAPAYPAKAVRGVAPIVENVVNSLLNDL